MNKLFVLFLTLTSLFVCSQMSAQDENIVLEEIIAVVGKETVLLSDIENQVLQLRAQGYYTSGDIKCEVFEQMLYSKFLVNQAKYDSVEVSDAEIETELDRRINIFVSQIGSVEKLEEFYDKSIDDIKGDFREIIEEQMLSQRLQQEATADLKVTPQEVKAYYKNIPEDSLPIVNTQIELGQIVVEPKIEEIEVLRIKDRLREFKQRVNKGESFSALAVLYSEDKVTATRGGELGFVSRGDLVPEFSAVAFNLDPGMVSKIVKTDYGFHIIQLIEKRGERINCRHILLKPKVGIQEKQKAIQKLDSIRIAINKGEMEFKEACWKYSENEDTRLNGGGMINPMTGDSHWEASQISPKVAYAIKNLKVGQISSAFESEDEQGNPIFQIVMLQTKTEPHAANLTDDYQKIMDMALEEKKMEFMDTWVKDKVKDTYLKISDNYKNCKFRNSFWANF